jgi:hypothetical protein
VLKVVEVRYPPRGDAETPDRQPKLKPTRGWTPTQVRGFQETAVKKAGTEPVYYLTPGKTRELEMPAGDQTPTSAPPPSAEAAAPAPTAKPKPVIKPVPVRKAETPAAERKPLPPVLTTTIGPGGPVGTMDHVPLPDARPLPAVPVESEPARPDGTCGRPGWWKNSWTQSCHPTAQSCRAADQSGACDQQ